LFILLFAVVILASLCLSLYFASFALISLVWGTVLQFIFMAIFTLALPLVLLLIPYLIFKTALSLGKKVLWLSFLSVDAVIALYIIFAYLI
ncbi:MAG: hypothetical protein J5922_00590, partial [Clostridia bacterium]|nr:hypothetical protein [Clostridia bacterium]